MNIEIGRYYVHKKTGKLYEIISKCRMKSNGMWSSGICYKALKPKDQSETQLFVRHLSNFEASFAPYEPKI